MFASEQRKKESRRKEEEKRKEIRIPPSASCIFLGVGGA